jgi:hypothetical protein
MPRLSISSWHVRLVHASVPESYAQWTHQFLTLTLIACISSLRACLACFEGTFSNFIRAFKAHISSWHVCSVPLPVPDAYSHPRISSLRVRSVYASVPKAHAQCTPQFLSRMLWVCKMNIWKIGKLMHILSTCVRNWCVWSGWASVPAAHAQCTHQFLTRMLSVRIKVRACA